MMDYRKREYQCPSRKSQNDYKYEMAYELGADYQEALVERKSEYLQNVKQKEICKHATEFGQEMEIMNNQNNQYSQNNNDRQHQSDRQRQSDRQNNQENSRQNNEYRSEFSQENEFQQNNDRQHQSDRQRQSDRQNNQSNRQNNK